MKNENIFDFYSNDLSSKSAPINNDDDNDDDNNDDGVVVENEKQNKNVTEIKNKCSQLNDSDN